MQMRRLWQVDAFTTQAFSGNPAGVVYPSDGLSQEMMLRISRELNNSETAFIYQWEDADVQHIRFFTPKQEVPLCTHASVASYHILATELGLPPGSHQMLCEAGLLPITIEYETEHPTIYITQKKGLFGPILSEQQKQQLLSALRLSASALYEDLPLQIVSTGNAKVLVGLKSKQTLDTLFVQRDLLIALGSELGVPGFYLYTFDQAEGEVVAHTRMFSPGSGVEEDPVTGNAAGALALYLQQYTNRIHQGKAIFMQGEAIKRTGLVIVQVNQNRATVLGQACTVFEAMLNV